MNYILQYILSAFMQYKETIFIIAISTLIIGLLALIEYLLRKRKIVLNPAPNKKIAKEVEPISNHTS